MDCGTNTILKMTDTQIYTNRESGLAVMQGCVDL